MERQTYTAEELAELLGISKSKAYQLIRQMNEELKEKGFLTCRGRIPKIYANERFLGMGK